MLEGQVAVLSSGYLSTQESLDVLDGLKNSLYLEQISTVIFYIQTRSFLSLFIKNTISAMLILHNYSLNLLQMGILN